MINRFAYMTLEHAIGERLAIDALCDQTCQRLADFCIADYVSDYRLGNPNTSNTLTAACAKAFFAENGPFLTQIDGQAYGREYNISLFGTFVVIEFNAFTPNAHFLVLAPKLSEYTQDAPYAGLWAAQKIEKLMDKCDVRVFEELDSLVSRLSQPLPTVSGSKKSFWRRLFKH